MRPRAYYTERMCALPWPDVLGAIKYASCTMHAHCMPSTRLPIMHCPPPPLACPPHTRAHHALPSSCCALPPQLSGAKKPRAAGRNLSMASNKSFHAHMQATLQDDMEDSSL